MSDKVVLGIMAAGAVFIPVLMVVVIMVQQRRSYKEYMRRRARRFNEYNRDYQRAGYSSGSNHVYHPLTVEYEREPGVINLGGQHSINTFEGSGGTFGGGGARGSWSDGGDSGGGGDGGGGD